MKENQHSIIWKHYVEKNALRSAYLADRKGKLVLRLKDRWCKIKWNGYAKLQCPQKRASSWDEGLSSLPGNEWAGADSQREIKEIMRRMTTRQRKDIQKKSIKCYLNVCIMLTYKKVFSFSGRLTRTVINSL